MIHLVIILSSEKELLFSSTITDISVQDREFQQPLEEIKETAQKLDQGFAIFATEDYEILVYKEIYSIVFVFTKGFEINQYWKEAAKRIAHDFASIMKSKEDIQTRAWLVKEQAIQKKLHEFEEEISKYIEDARNPPTKKMKESFW
ncbi:hypothetical protein EU523_01045 [Candidatus Heimdallarchaeota archaeon]|nr:MAG: hypothetical protein EU523_01045 [Candidatus Heimdallarchaeota archaeon]